MPAPTILVVGLTTIFVAWIARGRAALESRGVHNTPTKEASIRSNGEGLHFDPSDPLTVILLDDIGIQWDQAYKPNIDALAANGISFSQAWAEPICSPARAAFLTGRHPHNNGIGSLIRPNGKDDELRQSEITFAEVLEPNTTDLFGKWHVDRRPSGPQDQGFRNYIGSPHNLMRSWGSVGYYDYQEVDNGSRSRVVGAYATRATFEDAMQSDAPTVVIQSHAAHGPLHNPPGFDEQNFSGKIRASIEYLDMALGELLARRHGFDGTRVKRGYVILTADNGGDAKGTVNEGGIRVPFLIAGPGITPRVSSDLVSIVDIFPTVAEIRGRAYSHSIDGHSLVPIMNGHAGVAKTIYAEKFPKNNAPPNPDKWDQALMMEGYKLISDGSAGTRRLYAMPGETYIPESQFTKQDARAYRFLAQELPK